MASLNLTFLDASNERSTTKIFADEPADGAAYAALLAAQTPLLAAIQALSLGELDRRYLQVAEANLGAGLPTDPYAQRELKWLVPFRFGTPGNPLQYFTIPCANLVGASDPLIIAGTDLANLAAAEWVTFIAQIEAAAWGIGGGGNYVVEGTPYLVGRNI